MVFFPSLHVFEMKKFLFYFSVLFCFFFFLLFFSLRVRRKMFMQKNRKLNLAEHRQKFIVHALKKESLCVSVLGVGVKMILVARRVAHFDQSISCFCRFVNSGR